MFRLETDLSGVSITLQGSRANEEGCSCTLLYAMYKRTRPIPDTDRTADNRLALWTGPFITHNDGLFRIRLWEHDALYHLPQIALDELMSGDDLCAAPVCIEFQHTPYPGFAVDECNRGCAPNDRRDAVTTALHTGAYTPCIVAPRGRIADWIDYFGTRPDFSPFFMSDAERRGLCLSWLKPLLLSGDVRIEPLPGLLDRPVELIREEVSRETA